MNGFRKSFRKKFDPKNEKKNSKNQSEIAACEKKPLARKRIFVQTAFSDSTTKLGRKTFAPQHHFLLRRDQNHYSDLTSKIMKMCKKILKKIQRPNTIQIFRIVKKT